jgi:hypothetical protein
MVDKKLWEFDVKAILPKTKPKGKQSTVPEETWKELVKAFEESGNPQAKILFKGVLADLSLSTVLVKLREATKASDKAEVKTVRHIQGKTATGHKRYVVDEIFLKRKEAKA